MTIQEQSKTNYGALAMLTTVFFFWGFIAAGNSVFIPFCRSYFDLDQFQGQLVDFAFYGAYYLGALALFAWGSGKGKDIIMSWGYKRSIVYGLLLSAVGAAAMIISVYANVFTGMLVGLFIIGLGFSVQQTSANPFMISMGDEATGSNRINLGGGINSFGTTIGPVVVTLALFGTSAAISDDQIQALSLSKVILLYGCVGLLFLVAATMFGFSKKVPAMIKNEKAEPAKNALLTLGIITGLLIICFAPVFASYKSAEAITLSEMQEQVPIIEQQVQDGLQTTLYLEKFQEQVSEIKKPLEQSRMMWLSFGLVVVLVGLMYSYFKGKKQKEGWGAMQYPQLTLGMLAIFVYVGVEVAVGSNLGELLKQEKFGGFDSSEIAPFISMYWGSLMIGRWAGAINAFKLSQSTKAILRFIVPLIAFAVVLGFSRIMGYQVDYFYWYILCVLIQIFAFIITKDKPALTLAVFGILGVAAILTGLMSSGQIAIYAFLSAGLFCSIMWPCIFSLSLAGLGKYQSQGSGFLVMMILGGAIIPPLQGKLSDVIGIQPSFIVGLICFAYLAFFAVYVKTLLKKQGISFDDSVAAH
ncbi:MAG: MFS transporter [Crocinitomicaceae bacterium]|nr:MFS transporter [Crocinitomicaceae bacterium]MBK8925973.1 MFS transporter [Crocinitomicaceae bacterium]